MPYDLFWHLNPTKLEPFIKAYEIKRKMNDEQAWLMGVYVQSAVSVAVEHCLAGKKAKSEYIKEPMLSDLGKTQEEVKRENDERVLNQAMDFFAQFEKVV